ncbi:MAG: peptidoglycan-binding protein [Myxococcota bacterium]
MPAAIRRRADTATPVSAGPRTQGPTGSSSASGPVVDTAMSSVDLSSVERSSDTPMLDGISGEGPKAEEKQGVVLTDSMKVGKRGADVERLQEFLGLEVDGKFGDATKEAVAKWQADNGLEPDGIVGQNTLDALAVGAKGVDIGRTVRTGSEGKDVERLQRFLGLPVDGKFGGDTRTAVVQFQMDHGLDPDGVIGPKTREALAGVDESEASKTFAKLEVKPPKAIPVPEKRPEIPETSGAEAPEKSGAEPEKAPTDAPKTNTPRGELKSRWHDDTKFVPKYASTAYSESGIYRGKSDPYAVGAISKPTKSQDLGGKTYGAYQFESSVYKNGTNRGKKAVAGSTVMRFARWEGNPYGKQLQDVAKKHGTASKEFDALWTKLSHEQNKSFGEAQEKFMEKENNDRVNGFMDTIGASEAARKDPRLQDLVIGTYNQYSGLTKGIASHVAANNKKGSMSADEIGKLIQDYKRARVKNHFRSSPKAHKGIYSRIAREKAMFD